MWGEGCNIRTMYSTRSRVFSSLQRTSDAGPLTVNGGASIYRPTRDKCLFYLNLAPRRISRTCVIFHQLGTHGECVIWSFLHLINATWERDFERPSQVLPINENPLVVSACE